MTTKSISLFLLPMCLLIAACAGYSSTTGTETKPLPKMAFHKPKSLAAAVARLNEIHVSLTGDEELPSPTKFEVVEVIHGTGTAAHSHYHLNDNKGDIDHHGHEGMESAEKLHDVEIDVFTEFIDIARWLPSIAADSTMGKANWEKVKDLSGQLEDSLRKTFDESGSGNENRKKYNAIADQSSELIAKLEKLIESDAESENPKG